ncbi:alpha-hydroxy-acid oxidizing protein [Pseudomonas sp. GD03860]|uniref:alpha-hydroxy acid oxidase n=1 Tax=Pseudomonas TaxID=286 RepID=UPI0023638019|nr:MULTISPECIES: alpha-hydroxy acid oxidase [Pseudomonas]MDD2058421.1 alpha-hydroxy-acid oxidizing protein [Pseudomonas putida]MDH0640233.1 alpha-hydroxy-acid oxidizing protein [Pseudomonas sp. GD03860]
MTLNKAVTVSDLVAIARQRIPGFAFDYLDSGAGDDAGVQRNARAFEQVLLKPRYLRGLNVQKVNTGIELFGQTYAWPIGIAPTGMNQLIWPSADHDLGMLAKKNGIPVVNSTLATLSVDKVAALAPTQTWFQLYSRNHAALNRELLRKAWDAGVKVLVVTADLPSAPNRNRDARNGFGVATFHMTPRTVAAALKRPVWLWHWLRQGRLSFENLSHLIGTGSGNPVLAALARQTKQDLSWSDLDELRHDWPGYLVIKGILDTNDARECVKRGADGVWVSNHGGRQLESAPAALDCLAAVVDGVGDCTKVLFDSGVRSGEDVVKALALGADFVFSGRSFLYGCAAAGMEGAQKVCDLYTRDIARTMAQIGCARVSELNRDWLIDPRTINS